MKSGKFPDYKVSFGHFQMVIIPTLEEFQLIFYMLWNLIGRYFQRHQYFEFRRSYEGDMTFESLVFAQEKFKLSCFLMSFTNFFTLFKDFKFKSIKIKELS